MRMGNFAGFRHDMVFGDERERVIDRKMAGLALVEPEQEGQMVGKAAAVVVAGEGAPWFHAAILLVGLHKKGVVDDYQTFFVGIERGCGAGLAARAHTFVRSLFVFVSCLLSFSFRARTF